MTAEPDHSICELFGHVPAPMPVAIAGFAFLERCTRCGATFETRTAVITDPVGLHVVTPTR